VSIIYALKQKEKNL